MTLPPGDGREGRLVFVIYLNLLMVKQASRNWYSKLSSTLLSDGFSESTSNHSRLTRTDGSSFTVVLVYVDDILVTRNDLSAITTLKTSLDDIFKIKDLGTMKYFLRLEIALSPLGIFINQRKYPLDILVDSGNLGSRPASFPMDQNLKFTPDDGTLLFGPISY